MHYDGFRCLKVFVWLIALSLSACSTQQNFNRPFSKQSGAKVVPSGCHHRVGPNEILLFFLNDTEVEVTLSSEKTFQILHVQTRSTISNAIISDDFWVSHDGEKAEILETKQSKSSFFNQIDPSVFYLSSVDIKVAGDYKGIFTLQELTITSDGVTYPVEDISFTKDNDVIVYPWNC